MIRSALPRSSAGLRYYWSLGFLLALCLSLLLATAYLYSQTIQRQQDMISTVRENLLWASMQLERETQRWRLFLRDSALSSQYDMNELELRFEILYSRYVTLSQGELRQAIDQDEKLASLLVKIETQINQLDDQIQKFFLQPSGPYIAFNEGSENLIDLSNQFINQVISIRSDEATDNRNELLSTMFKLSVAVTVLIASAMVLAFLLVRGLIKERKQVATVSALAAQLEETAEKAKAASAAKSAFLAMMSHEIRTPLNGLMGMLNVLSEEPLAGKPRQYAKAAQDSADHLLVIVNDILDLSSIEAGRMSIINQPMSLQHIMEDIATHARAEIKSKPIQFQLRLDDDLPQWIEGDRIRLRQIVLNLVSNAIKFTQEGTVELCVQWRPGNVHRERGFLRIDVRDSGIGIDQEAQAELFKEFTQIDSKTNRRYGGTGLGLSICKNLVTLMGGSIGVLSRPGEGAQFWFEVPANVTKAEPNPEQNVIGHFGFSEDDLEVIDAGAKIVDYRLEPLENNLTLPPHCTTVLVNWQSVSSTFLQSMAHWKSTQKASELHFIAVVAQEHTALAYDFIKAGGQAILVRPLTASKLVEQVGRVSSLHS